MLRHSVYNHVINRRRGHRYPVGWRATLKVRTGDRIAVQLADVSEHGILFFTQERLKPGTVIEMDVYPNWRNFFRCNVSIVREGRRTAAGREFGAKFHALSDMDRCMLENGLRMLRGDSGPRPVMLTGCTA